MITTLFNQDFVIKRNYPELINGVIEDRTVILGTVKGRISSPSYSEQTFYQSRGMILRAVIYLDVYEFDEQRDFITDSAGVTYQVKGVTTFRDETGQVAYLKIPVSDVSVITTTSGSGGSES